MFKLAQIPAEGMFLGPTSFYNAPAAGYYAAPSGQPLMTPEITSPDPEHQARTFHCYVRNGQYTVVPFAQRDAMKAAGWEETDYANCAGSGVPMAQPVGTSAGRALLGQASDPITSVVVPVIVASTLVAVAYLMVTKKNLI